MPGLANQTRHLPSGLRPNEGLFAMSEKALVFCYRIFQAIDRKRSI
jgi:hypothetical protein